VIRKRVILLVEDNPNDIELTLRAFEKSTVIKEIVVARDGEQAIPYLQSTGPHADRDPTVMPDVVLPDM
jgi:two-component system, response regulator